MQAAEQCALVGDATFEGITLRPQLLHTRFQVNQLLSCRFAGLAFVPQRLPCGFALLVLFTKLLTFEFHLGVEFQAELLEALAFAHKPFRLALLRCGLLTESGTLRGPVPFPAFEETLTELSQGFAFGKCGAFASIELGRL